MQRASQRKLYLDLHLMSLLRLLHFTVLVAQLSSGVFQLLLVDLPEGIYLVLHTYASLDQYIV